MTDGKTTLKVSNDGQTVSDSNGNSFTELDGGLFKAETYKATCDGQPVNGGEVIEEPAADILQQARKEVISEFGANFLTPKNTTEVEGPGPLSAACNKIDEALARQ